MPLEIVTVPCRTDNYAYLLHDAATGKTGLVDAPDAGPIEAALAGRGWGLDAILITHHHDDHIEGVAALRERFGAQVIGAEADRHRLPRLDRAVKEGDEVALGESRARVIDVSGHTVGHVAYHFAEAGAVFTADSLMAMGCGRIFEGTAPMMWASLQKLAALPADTLVYSGHEYAVANARFAVALDGTDAAFRARQAAIEAARAKGAPTVPVKLSEELSSNPFLRASDPALKARIGMADAVDVEVFAEIRRRKDKF
jgi:hydroxyacylglutathione hydrolase